MGDPFIVAPMVIPIIHSQPLYILPLAGDHEEGRHTGVAAASPV